MVKRIWNSFISKLIYVDMPCVDSRLLADFKVIIMIVYKLFFGCLKRYSEYGFHKISFTVNSVCFVHKLKSSRRL